jgi:hypothetical protein
MCITPNRLLATFLLVPGAFGQITQSRVFHFKPADSVQDQQEMTTVIRSILDIEELSTDSEQNTLTVRGTTPQIAFADWLFPALDNSAQGSIQTEYRLSAAGDDVVHVFYLKNTSTVREFQELVTAVRSVAEIRRLFTYNAPKAVVARGTPAQIALAGWLFDQMDIPALDQGATHDAATTQFKEPRGESVVKVFYLTNTPSVADFQELVTLIRSTTFARRAFTYSTPKALVILGTAEQMALAAWLVAELDKPANLAHQDREYKVSANGDDVIRLFYFPEGDTVAAFQKRVNDVRKITNTRQAYTYNEPRLLLLRGILNEMAWADSLIQAQAK